MMQSAPFSIFLATTDADASRRFYGETLGLKLVSEDDFALVFQLAGAELRISKVPAFTPQPFTVLDWQVTDIAAAQVDDVDLCLRGGALLAQVLALA